MPYIKKHGFRQSKKETKNKLKQLRLINMYPMSLTVNFVGISMSTLQRYEADDYDVTKIKLSTLKKFAKLYDVPLRYLTDSNEIALSKEDIGYNTDEEYIFREDIEPVELAKENVPEPNLFRNENGEPASFDLICESFDIAIDICKLSHTARTYIKEYVKALLDIEENSYGEARIYR